MPHNFNKQNDGGEEVVDCQLRVENVEDSLRKFISKLVDVGKENGQADDGSCCQGKPTKQC